MIQSIISIGMLLLLNFLTVVDMCHPQVYEGVLIYQDFGKLPYSFALGGLILTTEANFQHEYGHHLQERELKHLYLLVVGGMSFIGKVFRVSSEAYGNLWTERQADELGGVVRRYE